MPNLERDKYPIYVGCANNGDAPAGRFDNRTASGLGILRALTADPDLMQGGPVRRNIIERFEVALLETADRLPTIEQLTAFQHSTSLFFGDPADTEIIIKQVSGGDFNFGGDVEAFFVSASSFYVAMDAPLECFTERMLHELDHCAVFWRYGIPVEFHMFLATDEEDSCLVDAFSLHPRFPEEMTIWERIRIMEEVAKAPENPSDHDLRWFQQTPPFGPVSQPS